PPRRSGSDRSRRPPGTTSWPGAPAGCAPVRVRRLETRQDWCPASSPPRSKLFSWMSWFSPACYWAEAGRWFSLQPSLPHLFIGRFYLAAEKVGVEQRAVAGQTPFHGGQGGGIGGQGHCQPLEVLGAR